MTSTPSQPIPSLHRRRLRRFTVLLALLVALGTTVWFLRASLLERVVTSLARTRAGLDVQFEGLVIEGLSRVRATRVVATARSESEILRSADITGLELDLHVAGLWTDSVVVESLRAGSARLHVDTRRGTSSEPEASEASAQLPDVWPAVRIDALDLDLEAAAGRARLRGARLALGKRPGTSVLTLDAESLDLRDETHAAEGPLTLRAAVSDSKVAIDTLRWEGVAEVRAAEYTPTADGGFDARLELDTRIGSAVLDARSDARSIHIRGTLARVELASILRLLGEDTDDYGGAWSARGSCVVPIANPEQWTADADIEVDEPRIAGRDADLLAGRFLATNEHYDARDVLVLAGANAALADLVRVERETDLGCEFLERATIVLDADLGDVQPLLGDAWSIPTGAPPHRVRARAVLADRWFELERGRAQIGASVVEVGSTRFPIGTGARLLLLDPSTEIVLSVRAPDSGELAGLLLPDDVARNLGLAGGVAGSVRLRSTATGVSASLTLRARDARVRGIAIDELEVRADLDDGLLSIEQVEVKAGTTSITARGEVDVRAQRFAGLEVDADVPDLRALGLTLGSTIELPQGRARVHARLDGPLLAPEGNLEAEVEDLVVSGVDIAWMRLRAHGEDGVIVVDELSAALPMAGTFRAAGRVRREVDGRFSANVNRLDIDALEGSAVLAHPALVTIGDGALRVTGLALAGGDGAARLASLHAIYSEGAIDGLCADITLESARVGRILRAFGVGVPASLRADGRATIALAGLATGATDGRVDAAIGVEVLDLSDVALPRGFQAEGRAGLRVTVSGPWRDPRGVLEIEAHDLDLRDESGYARLSGAHFTGRASVGEQLDFEPFVFRLSREARVEIAGRVHWPLDLDRISRGDFAGIEDAEVDLELHADAPDLAPLADAFDLLRRTEGSLAGELALRGTVGQPSLSGRILLRGGGVKLSSALPAISGAEVDIALDEGRLSIERAIGTYGGGQVEVSGTIDVGGAEPVLDLALRGTSIPLLRSAEISLRADVNVRVDGKWSALALEGNAALSDARFEQRLDLERLRTLFESKAASAGGRLLELPAITEPPWDNMRIELDVSSDTPVRVRTPLLQAQILTRLTIRGTGANPLLGGALELQGGRVALPASKLEISRGRVDFDPNDPGRAAIDVSAVGRVSGYEVHARVTGMTDDPIIDLSSIPPASQEDLALLLLAGRMPGARGLAVDQDRVVGEIASAVARDLAYEWFGDAGESFADRLELATGADVTEAGSDTIEVRFRLSGPTRGPGRVVYLRGERDIYDRVNMGVRFLLRMP